MNSLIDPPQIVHTITVANAAADPVLWLAVQEGIVEVCFTEKVQGSDVVNFLSWAGKPSDPVDKVTILYSPEYHSKRKKELMVPLDMAVNVIRAREKITVFEVDLVGSSLPKMICRDTDELESSLSQFWGEDGEWDEGGGQTMTIKTIIMSAKQLRDIEPWEP